MSRQRQRTIAENLAGLVSVAIGLLILGFVFWINRVAVLDMFADQPPAEVAPIEANIMSGDDLQQLLDEVAANQAAEEQARLDAIAAEKARQEAEEQARLDAIAAEKARQEAEEQARLDAIAAEKARQEAEEQAQREAEEQAQREAEEQAQREAEEQAQREAEEQARREAEEQAQREAEEKLAALDAPSLSDTVSSLAGQSQAAENEAIAWFAGALQDKMRPYWALPPTMVVNGLDAQLLVKVDNAGNVLKVDLARSSGNELFDNAAIQAVWKSSPLPMPVNQGAVDKLVNEGILGNFKP